ncbi:MAG: hypothetical protein PHR00_03620 [Patescibacteria group bacterium]|nr:hypothetical protein [Patescibacteria group bacterium]
MTKNNQEEKQPDHAAQINQLLAKEDKKEKVSWWKRLLHFGRMVGDVKDFVYEDDKQAAEKIRKDIVKIEAEREIERRALEAERERLEKLAKSEAKKNRADIDKQWQGRGEGLPSDDEMNIKTAADKIKEIGAVGDKTVIADQSRVAQESLPELSSSRIQISRISTKEPSVVQKPELKEESAKLKDSATLIDQKIIKTPELPSIKPNGFSKDVASKKAVIENKESKVFDHKSRMVKKFQEELKRRTNEFLKNEVENRYWQSFDMIRANLIKEQRSLFFNWNRKFLSLIFSSLLAVLVVLLVYVGLLLFQRNKLEENRYIFDNLDNIKVQISSEEKKAEEVIDFNERITYVKYLLDNHIYFSEFFKLLEDRTTLDVYFEKFSGGIQESYKLTCVAKDTQSIHTEKNVLLDYDQKVKGVNIGTITSLSDYIAQQNPGKNQPAVPTPSATESQQLPVQNNNVRTDMEIIINPALVFIK